MMICDLYPEKKISFHLRFVIFQTTRLELFTLMAGYILEQIRVSNCSVLD